MSAQTGTMPPSGPMSTRFVDRARFRVDRLRTEPNPIWIRELRQSARLTRTPVILTVITILMTLLIASIGGIVSTEASPATTGVVLFQVFFSLAYFVVTLVGPAVAANSIASEREGRTWEAVILTGLSPGVIARGKFLAAFTAIGMYIVMLAPVGALPFLFGGVTATETIVAFGFLFLVSVLSVASGLAVSSKMASLRGAILITLLLAFPITITAFSTLGPLLSIAANRAWPGVPEGPPIWLPIAYERAPFDLNYVVFLIVMPVMAVALPAWFLYEVTIANLTSVTDDRTTGLKRWFVVAVPSLTLAAAIPVAAVSSSGREPTAIIGVSLLGAFLTFCVFLFMGDPIGPSRRVTAHWDKIRAGAILRFLGPGVMRSMSLTMIAGVVSLGAIVAVGALGLVVSSTSTSKELEGVIAFGAYAIGFYVFVAGLGALLRARATSSGNARLFLFGVLFGLAVGPWVVAAIAGLIADKSGARDAFVIAAPSPFYAFLMLDSIHSHPGDPHVIAGLAMSVVWGGLGLAMLGAAARKCRSIIVAHEAMLVEADRMLAAEDEAANAPPKPVEESQSAEEKASEGEPPQPQEPLPQAPPEPIEPSPETRPAGQG